MEGGGAGGAGLVKKKNIRARQQLNEKIIHTGQLLQWPKKSHSRKIFTEKKLMRLKKVPPLPITFLIFLALHRA